MEAIEAISWQVRQWKAEGKSWTPNEIRNSLSDNWSWAPVAGRPTGWRLRNPQAAIPGQVGWAQLRSLMFHENECVNVL